MSSNHITTDIKYIAIAIVNVNREFCFLVGSQQLSGSTARIESFNPMRALTLLLSVLSTVSLCHAWA